MIKINTVETPPPAKPKGPVIGKMDIGDVFQFRDGTLLLRSNECSQQNRLAFFLYTSGKILRWDGAGPDRELSEVVPVDITITVTRRS